MPARYFFDLLRQQISSFGDHDRSFHLHLVFKRDGKVRRVRDDHAGLFGILQHLPAAHLALDSANASFDGRIAFRLLHFLPQVLAAHLQVAFKLLPDQQVVHRRPRQQHQT